MGLAKKRSGYARLEVVLPFCGYGLNALGLINDLKMIHNLAGQSFPTSRTVVDTDIPTPILKPPISTRRGALFINFV